MNEEQKANRELVEKYEAMPHEDKKKFIVSQNAELVKKRSPVPSMVQKYGEYYWAYQLDCGWMFCPSSSEEASAAKYKEFMEG